MTKVVSGGGEIRTQRAGIGIEICGNQIRDLMYSVHRVWRESYGESIYMYKKALKMRHLTKLILFPLQFFHIKILRQLEPASH